MEFARGHWIRIEIGHSHMKFHFSMKFQWNGLEDMPAVAELQSERCIVKQLIRRKISSNYMLACVDAQTDVALVME